MAGLKAVRMVGWMETLLGSWLAAEMVDMWAEQMAKLKAAPKV